MRVTFSLETVQFTFGTKFSYWDFRKSWIEEKTFEDFFDMKKNDLQSYLRDAGLKVSGNKRELAQMAFENLDANKSS